MLQKGYIGSWITGVIVTAALTAAIVTSFTPNGFQIETSSAKLTLKSSLQKGVTLIFDAP